WQSEWRRNFDRRAYGLGEKRRSRLGSFLFSRTARDGKNNGGRNQPSMDSFQHEGWNTSIFTPHLWSWQSRHSVEAFLARWHPTQADMEISRSRRKTSRSCTGPWQVSHETPFAER